MTLPTSYLTSIKNLRGILSAIQGAQAPKKFTIQFLTSLGFTSTADRLVIGVLRSLGFLNSNNEPTDRYFRFLDQSQSGSVLADGVRDAYADLFQINKNANQLSKSEAINKFKTLGQGQLSESVLAKMGMTFVELCKIADFKTVATNTRAEAPPSDEADIPDETAEKNLSQRKISFGGLHYNIQLILPESRDQKVYDALFRSLRDHLT